MTSTKFVIVMALIAVACEVTGYAVLRGVGVRQQSVPSPCVVMIGAAGPGVQATIYSADWCAPCRDYVAAVKKELPPDGWTVRDATDRHAATAHVVIKKYTDADQLERLPTTILRLRDGTVVDTIEGAITPNELAERLNRELKRLATAVPERIHRRRPAAEPIDMGHLAARPVVHRPAVRLIFRTCQ
jgi:thiol-disulfide isomerase/thioredoxin